MRFLRSSFLLSSLLLLLVAGCREEWRERQDSYGGRVPLLGLPLWTDPSGQEVKERMEAAGFRSAEQKTISVSLEYSLRWPASRTVTSLAFVGGALGSAELENCTIGLEDDRIGPVRIRIRADSTDPADVFLRYRRLCALLSDSLGEPLWTSSSGSRFFADAPFSDRERAFFSEEIVQAMNGGDSLPVGYRSAGREAGEDSLHPWLCMWQWRDEEGIWAVTAGAFRWIRYMGERGADTIYRTDVLLKPLPEIDLEKSGSRLAGRVRAYSGWIDACSDAWPNHFIFLCETDPVKIAEHKKNREFLVRHDLPVPIAASQRMYIHTYESPGMTQVWYAFDTSRYAPPNRDSLTMRCLSFFVHCKGVVLDTAETGYLLPMLYITEVSEIRYPEDPDCW